MIRRSFLISSISALCTASPSLAQRGGRVRRIGYLTGASLAGRAGYLAAFRRQLSEHGYVEGTDVAMVLRAANGRFDGLPRMAQELVALEPDVLFVSTTPAALAAKAATARIPIVFASVADPLGVGLVASLAKPGGNITGVTNIVADLAGKRVELLKALLPEAKRVAVLINPDDPNAPLQMRQTEAEARRLGLQLDPILTVRGAGDGEKAVAAAVIARADGALRMVDPTTTALRQEIVSAAARHRLPMIYAFREDVAAGGLLSYGTRQVAQYEQAATLIAKILDGAQPRDLPVERATTFEMAINLRAANALRLRVPAELVARADEVID